MILAVDFVPIRVVSVLINCSVSWHNVKSTIATTDNAFINLKLITKQQQKYMYTNTTVDIFYD